METVKLSSAMSWLSFQREVAERMDIAVKRLDLSYKLSTETKDAPSRVLKSHSHWIDLKERATEEHRTRSSGTMSKGCSGAKKSRAVEVFLIDQRPKAKMETQGKGKSKVGHRRKRESESDDSDNGKDKEVTEGLRHGNWVLNLQNKYACEEHMKQYCVVARGGIHMRLTTPDLSLWAMLIVHVMF